MPRSLVRVLRHLSCNLTHGDLIDVLSKVIYRGQIDIPSDKDRYPETVRRFNKFLSQIVPR